MIVTLPDSPRIAPSILEQPHPKLVAAGEFLEDEWEFMGEVEVVCVTYGWHRYFNAWRPTNDQNFPEDIVVETGDRRVGRWVRLPVPKLGPFVRVTKMNGRTVTFRK